MRRLTEEEIEAGKSPKGGFTKQQLAKWGVPWPAPKGWRKRLLGLAQPSGPNPYAAAYFARKREQEEYTAEELRDMLRKVVSAIVGNGHASDIYGFPDVLGYFGAQIPDDPNAAYRDTGWRRPDGTIDDELDL